MIVNGKLCAMEPGLEVINLSFVLNSAEYEILNAHKYKSIEKISVFMLR